MATEPTTDRGRETWQKIIVSAAGLMHVQGVQATTVDEVLAASGTGKGQFYSHFSSKEDLVVAVLDFQARAWLDRAEPIMSQLDSIEGFEEWFRRILARQENLGFIGGCPVGSMAAEMADTNPALRHELSEVFEVRRRRIQQGIVDMKKNGTLGEDADPETLARAVLSAIQGGLLLSSTEKGGGSLRASLEATLIYLRSFARDSARHTTG